MAPVRSSYVSTSKDFVVPITPHDSAGKSFDRIIGEIADRAIPEDELDLGVFIQSHHNRQTVIAPGIGDALHTHVRKYGLPILRDDPLEAGRENVRIVLCIKIGVLREIGERAAILGMELKTRERYLLATPRDRTGEFDIKVLKWVHR